MPPPPNILTTVWPHLLPLISAVLYAVAAICVKMALAQGMSTWRVAFHSNLVMGAVFLPLLLFGTGRWTPSQLPWAVVAGLLFFAGQIATFRSLQSGDVSIATPALASKVVFVALLSLLVPGAQPGPWLWVAVGLTLTGVLLLHSGRHHPASRPVPTLAWALVAALSFAAADILVQTGAPRAGFNLFMPVMFGTVALVSFPLLLPQARRAERGVKPPGFNRWAAAGVLLLGLQAVGMGVAIGLYGDATGANIIYGSRGLWSLLLLALVARQLGLQDSSSDRGTMLRRLLGGLLILAAVLLVLT